MPNPKALSIDQFEGLYREAVEAVFTHWNREMQQELSRHCRGWAPELCDFRAYLMASCGRYFRAYLGITKCGDTRTICDVGGFWGAFPMVLAKAGYQVVMTEAFCYYGHAFDGIFSCIRKSGVEIVDFDPFGEKPFSYGQFDAVTAMAILEHYPHSLARVMTHVVEMVRPGGRLFIDVPNIAYWPKRIALLKGKSPLVPIMDILQSEIPFVGHHHEFTMEELLDLVHWTGYSAQGNLLKRIKGDGIAALIQLLAPSTRECMAIVCRKSTSIQS